MRLNQRRYGLGIVTLFSLTKCSELARHKVTANKEISMTNIGQIH